MKIYCLCIKNINFILLKKLKLIPVGLGGEIFDKRWLNDKNKKNISKKNKYYGEYTFHYNLWKKLLKEPSGIDHYIIMEDDFSLGSNFKEKMEILFIISIKFHQNISV